MALTPKWFLYTVLISCIGIYCCLGLPTKAFNQSLVNCTKQNLTDLSNIAKIVQLNVANCNITQLENAFFIRFTSLAGLEITDSQLAGLEDYALHGPKRLQTLSLARNNISVVRCWSSEPMTALISLDLRRNTIRELNAKSFQGYPNLQRLNLAGNLLEDIGEGTFSSTPQLKYLHLGYNRLKSIEDHDFHGLHRLSYLALNFNNLTDIEGESFQTNIHLRTLRLEGNQLKELEFLKNMVRLVHLNLSINHVDSLERLTFARDYELEDLDISHNSLTEVLMGTFAGLESLERLNLSYNFIELIEPLSFQHLSHLEHIDLSNNNLTHIPANIFNDTTMLQRINLANNSLQDINATLFAGMSYLTLIDLSSNELQSSAFLEHLDRNLNRLELTLDLSDNYFQMLNMSWVLDLKRVDLAGNLWSCKWLIQEMLRTPESIHFGRKHAVVTKWSNDLLDLNGIGCYDETRQTSVVILDTSSMWEKQKSFACKPTSSDDPVPSPPPLVWPKVRLDKFDSRSVIIWMLIGICIAFSALRIGSKIIEKRDRRRHLQLIGEHDFSNSEDSKLQPVDVQHQPKRLPIKNSIVKV